MILKIWKLICESIYAPGKFSCSVGVPVSQHYVGNYLDAMVASKNTNAS